MYMICEIEDADHCIGCCMRCEAWKSHREPLLALIQEHQDEDDDDNLAAFLLSFACS